MDKGDRFHSIIAADPIRYELSPEAESIMVFFVIARASGDYEIVHVLKTMINGVLASRNIQVKSGIPPDMLEEEVDGVRIAFALTVEQHTQYKLKWNELDLSDVAAAEQPQRIQKWGRALIG